MGENKELKTKLGKDGKAISPILNEDVINYLIDIDGTITEDVPNEEKKRKQKRKETKKKTQQ